MRSSFDKNDQLRPLPASTECNGVVAGNPRATGGATDAAADAATIGGDHSQRSSTCAVSVLCRSGSFSDLSTTPCSAVEMQQQQQHGGLALFNGVAGCGGGVGSGEVEGEVAAASGISKSATARANAESDEPSPHVQVEIEESSASKPPCTFVTSYLRKFRGGQDVRLPIPPPIELLWSLLGAFLGILAVSGLNQLLMPKLNTTILLPSFGASAVLVFGVVESKLAQPRNFIGGQIISACVGILIRMGMGDVLWLSAPLGMSLALLAMQLTSTTHPPGGATALVASSAPVQAPGEGWMLLAAVVIGCLAMQAVALAFNNLSPKRIYPTYWW